MCGRIEVEARLWSVVEIVGDLIALDFGDIAHAEAFGRYCRTKPFKFSLLPHEGGAS